MPKPPITGTTHTLPPGERWVKYVFIVSSNVAAAALERVGDSHPEMEIFFQAHSELDAMDKRHPEFVK